MSLSAGSAVPADCVINQGQIDVDQAALTGESLPVTFSKVRARFLPTAAEAMCRSRGADHACICCDQGDSVKMGSTVVRGEVEGTVEATGANTFFGKTAKLINAGDEEVRRRMWMALPAERMTGPHCPSSDVYTHKHKPGSHDTRIESR